MATTWTRERVTISSVERVDLEDIQGGLDEATCGILVDLDLLPDGHPASIAWDRDVLDAAAAEVREEVARLLREAIERRLPWTWEPLE